MFCHVLRFGDDHRDGLTVPPDAIVLHDRGLVERCAPRIAYDQRRRPHPWGVLMRHDPDHAGRGPRLSRVDGDDAAFSDCCRNDCRVSQTFESHLGCEARGSSHLEWAIKA
jgi:hypothetical protein